MGDNDMNKIAVIFPGMGYGKDRPLLYYAARLAREVGYEIRYADYESLPRMTGFTPAEKQAWTRLAYKVAIEQLADIDWMGKDVVFIAKSVGTIIASQYARAHDLNPIMILLTPLDETFDFLCDGRNYMFSGDRDRWIDHSLHEDAVHDRITETYYYAGANHSLETGDTVCDLENLQDCIRHIRDILTGEEWAQE